MAGPNYVIDKGFKAGGAITKYTAVKLTAAETVATSTSTVDAIIGISQEEISAADATAGRIVNVRLLGISRAIVGNATTTFGQFVTVNATGQVIGTTTAGQPVLGRVLQTVAVTGAHVDVVVVPAGTPA